MQPTGLTCTVSQGQGSNVQAAITQISVMCSANTHTISGTLTGLTTTGLVLRNNGADNLAVVANATTFQFATPVAAGGGYDVTAFVQPAGLTCTVSDGVGSNVTANIGSVHIACSAITYTVGGTISGLTGSGLVLQNNNGDDLSIAANATTFEFATPVAHGGGYTVTVLTQPAGEFCSIADASGTATALVGDVALTCSQTTLTPSVSSIELAVNDLALNAALTGVPRQITLTNNGSSQAVNVSIAYPVWPTGTTASSTCGSILAAAQSCTITITPGSSATSNCSVGIAPAPGTITVAADNAPTSTVDAVVLSYGCIYQAGFIFSIDDSTAATDSIGGKVIALSDQVQSGSGIIWSTNGASSAPSDVSYDFIPGIDEISTAFSGSPNYSFFAATFSATYTNPNPFTSGSFSACNGAEDGHCNTNNILTFYNQFITNYLFVGSPPFTATSGPTPPALYAAGSCSQTIGGYSDWYLPAICEMGPASNGSGCAAGTDNVADNLPYLLGDPNAGAPTTSCLFGANCAVGPYWSSTQSAGSPNFAWLQFFDSSGSFSVENAKEINFGARCARVLTH
jgi:hypothetical protein